MNCRDIFLRYRVNVCIDSEYDYFNGFYGCSATFKKSEKKSGSSLHNCVPILHAMYNDAVQPRRNQNMRPGQASGVVYISRHNRLRVFRAIIEKTNIVSWKESALRVPSVRYSLRLNVRDSAISSLRIRREFHRVVKNVPIFFIVTSRCIANNAGVNWTYYNTISLECSVLYGESH